MPSCVLRYCTNNSCNTSKCKGVTFHRFPRPGRTDREKWIKLIQNNRSEETWLPSDHSYVCSLHFREENIYKTKAGRRFLKKSAVPCIDVQLAVAKRHMVSEIIKRMEVIRDENCTPHSTEDQDYEPQKGGWKFYSKETPPRCKNIKPTPRDIVRRIYAILPYFDRDNQNAPFLQKYRGTINKMSESEDMVDREVAFYAAVLTPIMFLQRYRDVRCLLERFEHALHEFQSLTYSEKRSALKHLQNLRDLSLKVRVFVGSQPVKRTPTRTPPLEVQVHEDVKDKKDIRFLKELIKNLG